MRGIACSDSNFLSYLRVAAKFKYCNQFEVSCTVKDFFRSPKLVEWFWWVKVSKNLATFLWSIRNVLARFRKEEFSLHLKGSFESPWMSPNTSTKCAAASFLAKFQHSENLLNNPSATSSEKAENRGQNYERTGPRLLTLIDRAGIFECEENWQLKRVLEGRCAVFVN